jgi:predicted nucleic acid-binding protein
VRFVDTNVLIYASLPGLGEEAKTHRANELLEDRELALSAQVLQEFYAQATRATRPGALSHERALAILETYLAFAIQPITTRLVLSAIATSGRFQISYWDAAIIEAARALRCDVVLSEDLNAGQDYDGVRVENPFAP